MSEAEGAQVELPLERVDPSKTRLLVVDCQNDFLADGGWFANHKGHDLDGMRGAVERADRLIGLARAAGVRPIFIQAIYDRKWLSKPMLERHELVGLDIKHCEEGTWGADFCIVSPEPGDDVVVKHRYSAFVGTELDTLLRTQGVENLVFVGVTTNVCVESTARDGYMRDYHIVVVDDCTASYKEESHQATLSNIRRAFGRVVSSEEIVSLWHRAGYLSSATEAA
jgi:ureidoacrylate peracid hydrolase